jgi:hypothetical protein
MTLDFSYILVAKSDDLITKNSWFSPQKQLICSTKTADLAPP